jgi:hypothetical protein
MKLGYVMGFNEAAQLSGDVLEGAVIPEPTYGECIEGVTNLCAAPENAVIPVYRMLFTFTQKFKGETEASINATLEGDRKFFSRTARGAK